MFTKLLVPLDRSSLAEQALGQAIAIASAAHAAIDLVLVHQPMTMAGFGDAPWNSEQLSDEQGYLNGLVRELAGATTVPITSAVMQGEATDMICQRARDVAADLVVMTSHGRTGFSRAWLGSVADGVMHRAAIPVLILRAADARSDRFAAVPLYRNILVPLDGAEAGMEILSSAAALARCADARITLLRVVQPVPMMTMDVDLATGIGAGMPFGAPPAIEDASATDLVVGQVRAQLADIAQKFHEREGFGVEREVVVANQVAQAIIDFARTHDVELIAMPTHGRGASRLLVGSVADKVIRASGGPVLLQRPVGVQSGPGLQPPLRPAVQLPALAIA